MTLHLFGLHLFAIYAVVGFWQQRWKEWGRVVAGGWRTGLGGRGSEAVFYGSSGG